MLVFFHLNCDSIRPFYLMLIHLIFHSDDPPPGIILLSFWQFFEKAEEIYERDSVYTYEIDSKTLSEVPSSQ